MLTFLFWNLDERAILDRVARIAVRRGVDVLCPAECGAGESDVLAALANEGGEDWVRPRVPVPGRVELFARATAGVVVEHLSTSNGRLSVREVRPPGREPFLVAAVHLIAKAGGWTDHAQSSAARGVAEAIGRTEDRLGNRRTILIGDLNMAPFAPGMIDGNVFHAHLSCDLAERKSGRVVDGEPCRRTFFNPMWQFMTDRGPRPPGTHYWDQTVLDNHYWYTLDQVLVRPELAGTLLHVEIVETDGVRSLLKRTGLPDAKAASDHLPVLAIFEL